MKYSEKGFIYPYTHDEEQKMIHNTEKYSEKGFIYPYTHDEEQKMIHNTEKK